MIFYLLLRDGGEQITGFDSLCFYLLLTPSCQVKAPTNCNHNSVVQSALGVKAKQLPMPQHFQVLPYRCSAACLTCSHHLIHLFHQNMMCLTLYATLGVLPK